MVKILMCQLDRARVSLENPEKEDYIKNHLLLRQSFLKSTMSGHLKLKETASPITKTVSC